MKSCHVYKTRQEYIVVTKSKTENWIRIEDDPIFRIGLNDKAELYKAVNSALASSREDIPDIPREDIPLRSNDILKKMGQKSYTELYKMANSCSIDIDEKDNVVISPYRLRVPGKYTGGLEIVKANVIEIPWTPQKPNNFLKVLIETLSRDYKK